MKNFEELSVWQEACKLAVEVYTVLNKSNDNGLKSQMQRAVVSIASNIAEGAERQSNKEFIQFLYIAKGSCAELRTQLYIAVKIQQITKEIMMIDLLLLQRNELLVEYELEKEINQNK